MDNVYTIHNSAIRHEACKVYLHTHPEFQPDCVSPVEVFDNSEKHVISKNQTNVIESLIGRYVRRKVENFICGEDLGTEITPRCGSCRCGKCPVVGHTYSSKEQQELMLIRENLEYDIAHQCWVKSYPWLVDPSTLPNNYHAAPLRKTEQTLSKDKQWMETDGGYAGGYAGWQCC